MSKRALGPGWLALRWAKATARTAIAWLLLLGALGASALSPATVTLSQAERTDREGRVSTVALPDWVEADGEVACRYRMTVDLGPNPHGLALYLPGMLSLGRIAVNGHVLLDTLSEPLGPRPRGLSLLRLLELPPAFLVDGANQIDITLRGRGYVSLSKVIVGDTVTVRELHDRKALEAVFGPMLVATVVGCLGASVLVLYLRRRGETMYAYFGIGSIAWGLHIAWTVLPSAPLPGVHNTVWWTTLYSFFVIMLLAFALRFAGYVRPNLEKGLFGACAVSPIVLYAANSFKMLDGASNAWRFGLVAAAFGTLVAVARSAWRERSLDSALLVVASLAAASFGLRDWIVFQRSDDNWPVSLTPYSALPLVILVGWFLIDRFVRTTESLEQLNRELEYRVEQKSVELTAALDDMRAARDRADLANQEKSSFLAAASHDLRQPIHALGLYLGALRQRPLDAAGSDIVERMDSSIGALDTMFNALLDISRMDAGVVLPQVRAFDLEAMLRRLAEEFAPQAAQRGLRLGVRMAATPGRACAAATDPLLLERVLRNLIGNAVKYTQNGGVLVTCRFRGRQTWRVEIWDTGSGIPEGERDRVFDEFYQVGNPERDRRNGLGLGLSIVRRITVLLQLPLELHSQPGRGTRFVLDLPATEEPIAPMRAATSVGSVEGLSVAIIEDDPEVRESMRTLLESWGCSVTGGSDAMDVLAHLPQGTAPHVVIADLRLRGSRDGIAEVALLRARFGLAMPAILVSADSAAERVRLMQDSGLPWLSKPVPAARLRSWLLSVTQDSQGGVRPVATIEGAR